MAYDNSTNGYAYLAKDNNSHTYQPPPWAAVPLPPGHVTSSSPFTRVDLGMSSAGTVFVVNDLGHLLEFNPATNLWADKGYPGVRRAIPISVSQSSQYSVYGPELANDGNNDGDFTHNSVTHTENQYQPYWQADLGDVKSVDEIDIYNRTDCCGDRLSNFNVMLSNDGTNWFYNSNLSGQAGSPTSLITNTFARYVRVQLAGTNPLSLAEVVIWEGDHDFI
jgi:hypothetical protein